jgi:hypothetical protein
MSMYRYKHQCGWIARIPDECKVEYSVALWTWMRWEQRVRGKNRETGEPVMCMEWVPHIGTSAEIMKEYREQFELRMPHVHRNRILKFMIRLQAEYMTSPEQMLHPTVSNMRADFAAAIEIPRTFSATCAFAEKINAGCLIMAYMPKETVDYRATRKRRPPAPVRSFDPILGTCLALAGPALSPALSPDLSPQLNPQPSPQPCPQPCPQPRPLPALNPTLSPVVESGRTVGPRPGTIAHAFARTVACACAPATATIPEPAHTNAPSPASALEPTLASEAWRGVVTKRAVASSVGAHDAANAKAAPTPADADISIYVWRVRFQTHSFAGVFSTKHKPSAHIFTLMREDFEHLIKFGTTLHGEVICTVSGCATLTVSPTSGPFPTAP